MKSKFIDFGLVAATIVGCLIPITANAGSIQILPASTSKIEVIGIKKGSTITPKGVKKTARPKSVEMKTPELKTEPKTVKAMPVMPKMRTGEIDLPIVPVSQSESK